MRPSVTAETQVESAKVLYTFRMIVLGIETSCDETAASVVQDGRVLLSNVVFSSMDLHKVYGGVVPEIAARSHIEAIMPVIDQALSEAFASHPRSKIKDQRSSDPWDQIDAIAVTYGAGLGGSLLVGVMTARTLAIAKGKPLYGVNHVEGHVYANFLTESKNEHGVRSEERGGEKYKEESKAERPYALPSKQPEFPLLSLIVSGGHTQLVLFRDHFDYMILGVKKDDAVGEAFDKVAKIIGLPYPGGPSLSAAALKGDPNKYKFPKARLENPYDFSFSGLKTAVLRLAQDEIGEDFTFPSYMLPERLSEVQRNDIAASFQRTAIETLVEKTAAAYEEFKPESVVIAGGVAANSELRRMLAEGVPCSIDYTDIRLCTDNGAMIATLGCYKAMLGVEPDDPYSLDIEPRLKM